MTTSNEIIPNALEALLLIGSKALSVRWIVTIILTGDWTGEWFDDELDMDEVV